MQYIVDIRKMFDISSNYKLLRSLQAMAVPTVGDWRRLKRLGRYLAGNSRYCTLLAYQTCSDVQVAVDTEFAGCRNSRKSTSGGVARMGINPVKTWSSNQAVVALSSGEAEYYGLVKGSSVGVGIRNLLAGLGINTGTV